MPNLFEEISQQIRQQDEDNLKGTLQRVHENRGRKDLPGSEDLQLSKPERRLGGMGATQEELSNPYERYNAVMPGLGNILDLGGSVGPVEMKVGDFVPGISNAASIENMTRPREHWTDKAMLPFEVAANFLPLRVKGKGVGNRRDINWDPKAMDKVEQMTKQVAPLLSKMNPSEVNLHNALQKTLLKEPMSVGKFSEVGGPKSEFNAFVQAQRKGGAEGKFMNDIELDAQGFSHLLKRRIIDQGLAGESPEVIAKALRSHIEEPSKGISRAAKTTGIGTKMSSSKGTGGTVLKAGSHHSGMNRNKAKIVSSFKDRKG